MHFVHDDKLSASKTRLLLKKRLQAAHTTGIIYLSVIYLYGMVFFTFNSSGRTSNI